MDRTDGWCIDADLAIPPLERRNWSVDWVPWRSGDVHWDEYDAVYIGVAWDYPEDVGAFVATLERIDRSRSVLVNDLELVRWSLSKTYLRDLEARGAGIVPSRWHERLRPGEASRLFEQFETDRLIVKPVVSTNASDTFLLGPETIDEGALLRAFRDRAFVVQPFIADIRSEGEYSLFYFAGGYSHAIRKVPRDGDFRVQEEFGAAIRPVEPGKALIDAGDAVMRLVRPTPVYARVDLVRGPDGRFLVMELELVEPSLYLRMVPAAPERFAAAFDAYVTNATNA